MNLGGFCPNSREGESISLRIKIAIGLTIVSLIWGSTWLAIKFGISTVPPFLAAGLRFLIATLILRAIMLIRKDPLPREKIFWVLVAQLGLLTYTLPFAFIYWGQSRIPTGLSSILFATFPFWVALFSHLRLENERINYAKAVGVIAGFVGVFVIFSSEVLFEQEASLDGMVAIVASALMQGYGLVSLKKWGKGFNSVAINFAGMMIGSIILLGASLVTEDYTRLEFNSASLIPLLYLSTLGTVLTYVMYYWLAKHVNAVLLSMTAFVTPIIAVVLGAMVLREHMSNQVFVGGALVLGGIVYANAPELMKYVEKRRAAVPEEST